MEALFRDLLNEIEILGSKHSRTLMYSTTNLESKEKTMGEIKTLVGKLIYPSPTRSHFNFSKVNV